MDVPSSGQDTELERFLAKVARDRIRVLSPVLIAALAICIALSEPSGIPLNAKIVGYNLALIALAGALYLGFGKVRGLAISNAAGGCLAVLAPFGTLATESQSGKGSMVMLVMLGLVTSVLQVSRRWMMATTALVICAWLPVGLRDSGAEFTFYLSALLGAGVVATILQHLLLRSVIVGEERRLEERRIGTELAHELRERKRAEAEREQAETARAQLQEQFIHAQRLEAVGTLAAGLAHDMNNILAGILATAELMGEGAGEPAIREDCARIVEEAERGAVLTRSLLAFSRRGQYRREPVTIRAVLDAIQPLLSRTLPKGIRVVQLGATDAVVDADAVQLGQAIVNLCLNGADAMDGIGQLTITTTLEELDDPDHAARLGLANRERYAVISIADTGRGMDEATRRRIFEPFFTTKPLGKGTGLGLAMVYGAVSGHDGAIEVTSEPGRGAQFRIFLPVAHQVPVAATSRPDSGRYVRPHLVLIVDDEAMVRRTLERLLERMGLTALVAEDGERALLQFDQHGAQLSLVVLDMGLPGMGGPECFRRLRARSPIPILICSGYALATETSELLSHGPAGFLEKPFTGAQLALALEQLLGLPAAPPVAAPAVVATDATRRSPAHGR